MKDCSVCGGTAATTKGKRVYISGPIANYNVEERKHTFSAYADLLRLKGYTPVNPFCNPLHLSGNADADWREHMREDIKMLLDCDYILMLPQWEKSKGCKLELDVASSCGVELLHSPF